MNAASVPSNNIFLSESVGRFDWRLPSTDRKVLLSCQKTDHLELGDPSEVECTRYRCPLLEKLVPRFASWTLTQNQESMSNSIFSVSHFEQKTLIFSFVTRQARVKTECWTTQGPISISPSFEHNSKDSSIPVVNSCAFRSWKKFSQ